MIKLILYLICSRYSVQYTSNRYRIAVGGQQGQKVFSLQTLPPSGNESNEAQFGKIAGFSLHAGIMARRDQRKKLERLWKKIEGNCLH